MAAFPAPGWPPPVPTVERVRLAYQARPNSDYIFSFWTAFGWFVLTLGFYGFYVLYQLVRRSRDHNRRRLEMLDATAAWAWERANEQGKADELRPQFERVALWLDPLRRMTQDFREPAIWVVLDVVARGV